MTPKQRKIQELIHDVWRQNPRHDTVVTTNPCDCGRRAVRGTGACILCIREKLEALTGKAAAMRYLDLVAQIRVAEWQLLNGEETVEGIKQERNDET